MTEKQEGSRVRPIFSLLFFLPFWNLLGVLPVFQVLAHDLYGEEAEFYFNFNRGVHGTLCFFAGPLMGHLSDRYGRRPVLAFIASALLTPALALYTLALFKSPERYEMYLVLDALSGLSGGVCAAFALAIAYISDLCPKESRSAAVGRMMAIGACPAMILGPLVNGWIYKRYGARGFSLAYVTSLALQALAALAVPESKSNSVKTWSKPFQLSDINPFRYFSEMLCGGLSDCSLLDGRSLPSALRCLYGVVFLLYVSKMGFLYALGLYAQDAFAYSPSMVGLLGVTYGMFQLVGQASTPFLVGVFSQHVVVRLGVAAGCLAGTIAAIPMLPGWTLFVSEMFLGLSGIALTVSISLATQIAPPQKAGIVSTFMNTATAITSGIGPVLFGAMLTAFSDAGFPQGAFIILTVIMTLGLLLTCFLPPDAAIRSYDGDDFDASLLAS